MPAGSNILLLLGVGVLTGIFAGLFGVGGGIILVPLLIWLFGYSQHDAQGTSLLALLLPVGALGVWAYYRNNPFPLKPGLIVALGIFIGGLVGGLLAQKLSGRSMRIAFGILTISAGLKLIFGK